MNWDAIGAITQIIGVIAVVVTLVYLAIQTKQNTSATQAAVRQAMLAEDRELLMRHLDFPFLSPLHEKSELSDEEEVQWMTWVMAFIRAREHHWLQYRTGNIDRATWNTYRSPIRYYLKTELGASFWREFSPHMFDPDFVADIDDLLQGTGPLTKQEIRKFFSSR